LILLAVLWNGATTERIQTFATFVGKNRYNRKNKKNPEFMDGPGRQISRM
jgi:hypothetical protein